MDGTIVYIVLVCIDMHFLREYLGYVVGMLLGSVGCGGDLLAI